MSAPSSKLQTLSLSQMGNLARPTDEKKFTEALKRFPPVKASTSDAESFERESLSALLRLSTGKDSPAAAQGAPHIPHAFDNSNPEQFNFKPSAKGEIKPIGEGHVPNHLGIAPIARALNLPVTNSASIALKKATVNSGLAPQYLSNGINVDRLTYPWSCIGKVICTGYYEIYGIRIPIGQSGTGTMVGRNLMITASHVIPRGAAYLKIEFIPALSTFDPKTPFQSAFVIDRRRHTKAKGVTGYDICVCRLDRNMGDLIGWMGYAYDNNDDFYYQASFSSAGYPATFYNANEMIAEYNLKVRDIDGDSYDGKEIEFDAFTNHGWSGGPLFAWFNHYPYPLICGVLSGREKDGFDPTRTVFAGGKRLVDLVNYGNANWQ